MQFDNAALVWDVRKDIGTLDDWSAVAMRRRRPTAVELAQEVTSIATIRELHPDELTDHLSLRRDDLGGMFSSYGSGARHPAEP